MRIQHHKQGSRAIVYDADRLSEPGADWGAQWFDAAFWRQQGRLAGAAQGRGSALFVDTAVGPAVLRQYLRGGWPARFSRERYLFTGHGRSRPLVEFRILAQLAERGLPAPRPLAAQCLRQGLFYRGWLLMDRIADVSPLADLLAEDDDDVGLWRATGATVRRFHDAGVIHADLNARNILVGPGNTVYLVDFDRARIRPGAARAFAANLARLRRSLVKLWPPAGHERLPARWASLMAGYESASKAR